MTDTNFAEKSLLEILVPEASKLDIEAVLKTAAENSAADVESILISAVPQRNLLFFDENLPIYLALRCPYHDEVSLKDLISRLAVNIEAHAVSSPASATRPNDGNAPPLGNQPRDVVWSKKLDTEEDPLIVMLGSDEEHGSQEVLLVWKMFAFLSRPRIRLQAPAVIFKVSASMLPPHIDVTNQRDPYLRSGTPFPINVLQPLSNDPNFKDVTPQLSFQKLSRAVPAGRQLRPNVLPLKVVSRRPFRAIPALSSRIRYHRPPVLRSKTNMIATLELDVPVFAQHAVELISVRVSLTDGHVEDMTHGVLKLPLRCHARDNVVCLYSISPDNSSLASPSLSGTSRTLDVMINARVLVSSTCRPKIEIRWKANVDFATPLNPNYAKPSQSLQRNSRPASLLTAMPPPSQRSSVTAITEEYPDSSRVGDLGVVMSFTSRGDVYVGEPFQWDLFIINRYSKPRTLGFTMTPAQANDSSKRPHSRPESPPTSSVSKTSLYADAVIDDSLLHTAIKTHRSEATQLVCLNADIRVGPLDTGACSAVVLEFLPLAKGRLKMEGVKVTDLETNETADVRELPDIVALERTTDSQD